MTLSTIQFPTDFYSVAAQIILALFVLAAVEYRLLELRPAEDHDNEAWITRPSLSIETQDIVLGVGLVATFTLGLSATLLTLYQQHSTTHRDLQIIGTMAVELLLVFGMALASQLVPLVEQRQDDLTDARRTAENVCNERADLPHITDPDDAVAMAVRATRAKQALRTAGRSTHRWLIATKLTLHGITIAPYVVPIYALGVVAAHSTGIT